MKKSPKLKKITLHRETLLRLDGKQIEQVVGGDPTKGAATCFCTETCTLMPRCH